MTTTAATTTKTAKPEKKTAFETITEEFLSMLKAGVVPWTKPWTCAFPKNLVTKKEYRGINRVWLQIRATQIGGGSWWGTFKQIQELGGQVLKGSKGSGIIFYKLIEAKDAEGKVQIAPNGKPKMIPLMRSATVFNITQTNLDPAKFQDETAAGAGDVTEPMDLFTEYITREGIKFTEGGLRAFYRPSEDSITLPPKETFKSGPEYVGTLFHEAVHSTGHTSRLNRLESARFGSEPYSREELVAEMGAAFLCHRFGVLDETKENSAAYLKSWLQALTDEPKMILQASSAAEKAYARICGE